jgi:hypothetical protein
LIPFFCFGQIWVDTVFTIQSETGIEYGIATDFAGASQSLELDISYPVGDVPPECGRPLLVMIHGGAWFAGDKALGNAKRIREDFAKRGYTTASVNYRLGLFNTNLFINCNVPDWNCWNMTDSTEWYRANYRAMQDVNGAIRFLVNHADDYSIDPNNIFLVGESAGGFVAMATAFIDDESEVLSDQIASFEDAPAPNSLYESNCIQKYNLATDIASMDLSRTELGSYEGSLNQPVERPYKIQAVGNFYGGVFNNIFQSFTEHSPSLYMFHQPCDLIVPFNYSRLLAGYNNCLSDFPSFCGYIVNRPFGYGSRGIQTLIDSLTAQSLPTTDYLFDNSSNNYNCLQQASNPSFGCHAIDNYWLRTQTMASFFAEKIDSCTTTSTNELSQADLAFKVYPNPGHSLVTIELNQSHKRVELSMTNLLGDVLLQTSFADGTSYQINLEPYPCGLYLVNLKAGNQFHSSKLIIY